MITLMNQSICILGRQPALGLAELESLFGAEKLRPVGKQAVELDIEPGDVPLARLGGTQKVCKVLRYLPYGDWRKIEQYLIETIPQHLDNLPEGKLKLGLSLYGLRVGSRQINASGLSIKKSIKAAGRSVRVVPNSNPDLSTAQTIHNNLTGELGMELVLLADGKKTVLAQVTAVQDITAYGARDQARPKRDARVGMLPPKLAQIIINLAVGKVREREEWREEREPQLTPHSPLPTPHSLKILDPFCGTGVVLQEALLMGYDAYGADLEPRMVEYSQTNLEWLVEKFTVHGSQFTVATGDATDFDWTKHFTLNLDPHTLTIASETYLGRAFSAEPRPEVLREVMQDVDTIHRKFLKNVARQTSPGFRMCIAVPAWKSAQGFKHLKVLDSLEEIGYTRQSFKHSDDKDMVYHRPEQIVGRELVVLVRK